MFFVYFLYSASSDIYYIGHTNNIDRRLAEHNHSDHNTFTSKHRPWVLQYYFKISNSRSDAQKIENFIKKQKSRRLIVKIIDDKLALADFSHVLK